MNGFSNLESMAGHHVAPALNSGPVAVRACFVARQPITSLGIEAQGSAMGWAIETMASLDAATRLLASRRSGWNLVLIALDDFSETSGYIDHLRRLRSRAPNLPVILMSSCFHRNDLGQERLAIGDVSLICPVDPSIWGEALAAARENNLVWRKRRRSLLLEKSRLMA